MKFKIAFFDCDGVLTTENIYIWLNNILAPKNETFYWFRQYEAGQMSLDAYSKIMTNFYNSYKLTKNLALELLESAPINEEAYELMKLLRKKGIYTAIISRGLDIYVDFIAEKLRVDTWRSGGTMLFNKDGTVRGLDLAQRASLTESKVFHVKNICKLKNVRLTDTFFVGDSKSDLSAFKLTKHGIAYKSTYEDLNKNAWKRINHLGQIVDLI